MEPALVAGKVDAISVQEPFAAVAARRPETRVLSNPWGDVLPRFLIASWFASEKWLQKNKEASLAFVRAINKGRRCDPRGQGRRARGDDQVGRAHPDFAGRIGLPLFEKAVNEKDVQVTMDLTYKYKMISRALKAKDVLSDLAGESMKFQLE
jgi:hypothetical protein